MNLSNHPVAGWSEAQRSAARTLGFGAVVDLDGGMALVPPDADPAAVWALAESLAQRALAQGARGAMVSSDFTLTYALVRALEARGVRCFAATTARVSEERALADGAVEKTLTFRFVRFRAYVPDGAAG